MPDTRSLEEKLQAMADQTISPNEAELAREALARIEANRANSETPAERLRRQILGAPDVSDGRSIRFYSASRRQWVTLSESEAGVTWDE